MPSLKRKTNFTQEKAHFAQKAARRKEDGHPHSQFAAGAWKMTGSPAQESSPWNTSTGRWEIRSS